ncbi:E3 ubiquitin-protein ligase RNF186 [Brienomyrus brachyistius]|uniref:E3 ubiquitin-protein ligase RNF186 n=1 Tax=Brienomyrus brachyistius TaxID=42636 RepID=UPI0020B2D5A6|nr:E3 ubiquitin-protein ligase RNF186 [Brienomyrus brachyistius]
MVLYEDNECSVCYMPYSRHERVPRVLYCEHTFCGPCLEQLAQPKDGLLSVCCPLCRRITCVTGERGLQATLWVNSDLWEQISENKEEEVACVNEEKGEPNKILLECSSIDEWSSTKNSVPKLRLPTFLKKFSLSKHQQQETVLPASNVEMKSWRRLSAEEMVYRN